MPSPQLPSSFDLSRAFPKLRDDLAVTPQTFGGQRIYIVEDPLSGNFYRLGLRECEFLFQLDGTRSVQTVLQHLAETTQGQPLSEGEAIALCHWLVGAELVSTPTSVLPERLADVAALREQRSGLARINPLMIRIPLLVPDRFLELLRPWLGWIYSPPVVALAAVLLVVAGIRLLADGGQLFVQSLDGIFAPAQQLKLLACSLVLKLAHEISHGVACRRYGGYVRESGVLLLLFAPIPYIDVTSSWKFRSKWQRIQVAAAGMYVELILAAVAALVWSTTDQGPLNQLCANVVLMASITTVIFNANPLMRFDGYYILSDWLEIPNLYSSGQQYVMRLAKRVFLNVSTPNSLPPTLRGTWVKLYGCCAFVWRLMICVSLVAGAAALFHGAGIVLAIVASAIWLLPPVCRLARYLFRPASDELPQRLRLVATAGGLVLLVLVAPYWIPWPFAKRAPAIVRYAPLEIVRSESAGFVQQVCVRSGQPVAKGEVLAVLENEELASECRLLDLAVQQASVRCRMLRKRRKMAALQAEQQQLSAVTEQFEEKRCQLSRLTICASRAGTIIGRNLEVLVGTYLKEGDEICGIGDERQKEILISINQDDVNVFHEHLSQTVAIRMPGSRKMSGILERIPPSASRRLPHAAFGTTLGGPLMVRARSDTPASAADREAFEMIEPRFTGYIALSGKDGGRLHAGRLGLVSLRDPDQTLATVARRALTQWFRAHWELAL